MKFTKFTYCTICIVALGFLFALSSCGDTNGPNKDSDTSIISFKFEDFTPAVVGTINNSAHTVALKVPPMTNKTYLVPTIVVADGASINPASGILQDFNTPVQYTVTAKDGTKAVFTVTVTEDNTSINPIILSGTYNENKSLPNVRDGVDYIINERIYISGNSLLTVEPGVTIQFTSVSAAITIQENAGLQMKGTALKPIIFEGPTGNPNKASWAGIELYSNRADNVWQYVQIYNGGSSNDEASALFLGDFASLSMENCSISGAGYFGIYLDDNTKFTKYENNIISGCENAPIYCAKLSQLAQLNNTSTYSNNAKKYIVIEDYNHLTTDLTINELDVPYLCKGIYIEGANITISPGVTIISDYDGIFMVDNGSKIIANGTALKPIVFTAKEKEPGQWKGMEIYSTLSNSLTYVTIEYGGQTESQNLYLWDSKVGLSNVAIKNSLNYGIYYNNGSTINHSNVTFENNANGNVYLWDDESVHDNLP